MLKHPRRKYKSLSLTWKMSHHLESRKHHQVDLPFRTQRTDLEEIGVATFKQPQSKTFYLLHTGSKKKKKEREKLWPSFLESALSCTDRRWWRKGKEWQLCALRQLHKTSGRFPTICKSGLQGAIIRCQSKSYRTLWQLLTTKNITFLVIIIHSVDKSQIAFEYLSEALMGKVKTETLVIITFALCAF